MVIRTVMGQLVSQYRHSDLENTIAAYDGHKILYTARPLPSIAGSMDFSIALPHEDGRDWRFASCYLVLFVVFNCQIHP
jgi:hypothetical protein